MSLYVDLPPPTKTEEKKDEKDPYPNFNFQKKEEPKTNNSTTTTITTPNNNSNGSLTTDPSNQTPGTPITNTSSANQSPADLSGWTTSIRLLPSHLRARGSGQKQSVRPQRPSGFVASNVFSPTTSTTTTTTTTITTTTTPATTLTPSTLNRTPSPPLGFENISHIQNEYDPSVPNDYDKVVKERKRQKILQIEEEERKRKREEEEEEERRREKELKKYPPPSYGNTENSKSGESVAEKLMAKMGWKGQGLGKTQQGISTPLMVEKVGKAQGIIKQDPVQIFGKEIQMKNLQPPAQTFQPPPQTKSTVLLLRNMVGPGEVDASLQEETAEECARFGKVERCLIYEVPGVPEDQAVRIFVKFNDTEATMKALLALNGRYFAKRMVKATLFDETRFAKLDLAPKPEEMYN